MGERDDDGLGLSLSLTFSQRKEPNLPPLMTSSSSPPHIIHKIHHNNWSHLFQSSERNVDVGRFYTRGIDVNKAPVSVTVVEVEEDGDGGVSSPNSTVSSVSGNNKRSERDLTAVGGGENDGERASCSHGGGSDDDDGANGGDGSRKKLRLSKDQALVLEETFKEHSTLNPKQKVGLAKKLNLTARQVEVWFQNRRARTKLKQTEVDCEYLKRCCDNLTEENRRLQKEVTELRTLKLSPHLYMHMTPPTTLTMCPSCERVAVSSAGNVNPTVRRLSPQRPGPGSPWTGISLEPRPAH